MGDTGCRAGQIAKVLQLYTLRLSSSEGTRLLTERRRVQGRFLTRTNVVD